MSKTPHHFNWDLGCWVDERGDPLGLDMHDPYAEELAKDPSPQPSEEIRAPTWTEGSVRVTQELSPAGRLANREPNRQPREEGGVVFDVETRGIDFGQLEYRALSLMFRHPLPDDTEMLAAMIAEREAAKTPEERNKVKLKQLAQSYFPNFEIEDVAVDNSIHDSVVVTARLIQPLEFIQLDFHVTPKREEKQMILLCRAISQTHNQYGFKDDFVMAITWDRETAQAVMEKIQSVEKMIKDDPSIDTVAFTMKGVEVFPDDGGLGDQEWPFPILWPRSHDRDCNEESGTDLWDLGDILEGGDYQMMLGNGASWRSFIQGQGMQEDNLSYGDNYRVLVKADGDEIAVWFEAYALTSSGHTEECVTSYSADRRSWGQLVDATATLDQLWKVE